MRPTIVASCGLLVACAACALTTTCPAQETPPPFATQRPRIKTGEPVLKFNGKNLEGFYIYLKDSGLQDPDHVFQVENGMIHVSGLHMGGLITSKAYRDYHLVVEWKWGERTYPPRQTNARDSGILLHCVGAEGAAGGVWMESQECQIIEGGCGDFIMVGGKNKPRLTCRARVQGQALIYDPSASEICRDSGRFDWWGRDPHWQDTLGFRGKRDVEKPAGEWNTMEVVCAGDTITNIVNGYVVNQGTGSSLTEGKILFQSEGAEIFFRKIEIRPLIPN